LGMSEAAWRRLGPLQPFVIYGVAAASGGLGALATYFPWLKGKKGLQAAEDLELVRGHAAAMLGDASVSEIEELRMQKNQPARDYTKS